MNIGTAVTSAFDQELFMKLLVTELQNQDPDNPVSNAEMTSQISSMAMVQGMNTLNTSFSEVLKLQRLLSSADLVGRQIEYDDNGYVVRGQVQSVDTSSDDISLVVDGNTVPVSKVTRIL